jgi:LmbE family N-acetylglucosaminyl deacetylase
VTSKVRWRALVVTAHPDDIEFGCGGTVATWTDAGAEVTYCIVTDGSTGTQDRSLMGAGLTEVRRAESEAAAKICGVDHIEWLGYRDGYVEYSLDLRRDIARVFRKFKPHRYLVMDPTPTIDDRFINHPDHRAIGQASLDVTLTAGTTPGHFPELLEEGLDPWRGLRETWIVGPGNKPILVDITETIKRKLDALMCHVSQVGDNRSTIEGWIKAYCAEAGAPAGYAYAESFQVIAQGPGFHADEQEDLEGFVPAKEPWAPVDPRSAPS